MQRIASFIKDEKTHRVTIPEKPKHKHDILSAILSQKNCKTGQRGKL